MPNESSFAANTSGARVTGTLRDNLPVIPNVPPMGLQAIGPRVTFNFAGLWDEAVSYEYYDVVRDAAGASYIARVATVPAGTPLTDNAYWIPWADPNAQFDELNNVVQTFDGRITANTEAIANIKPQPVIPGSPSNGTLQALYNCIHSYIKHGSEINYKSRVANGMSYGMDPYHGPGDVDPTSRYAMNCSCFVLLNILGVDWDHSRYKIGGSGNILGAMGYCYNPYGEEITGDNYQKYNTSYLLCERMIELGLAELVAPDFSNVYPGDVIFNITDRWDRALYPYPDPNPPEDADQTTKVHHCRLVLQTGLSDPNESRSIMVTAECATKVRPIVLRGQSLANLDNVTWVAHIPYQTVPEQPVKQRSTTFRVGSSGVKLQQLYDTYAGGMLTLEFDLEYGQSRDGVRVYVDGYGPMGSSAVDLMTKVPTDVNINELPGKRHYVIPFHSYHDTSGTPGQDGYIPPIEYSPINFVTIYNDGAAQGNKVTNVRLYDGFGAMADNTREVLDATSLADIQNAIIANIPVSASYGAYDFVLPVNATEQFVINPDAPTGEQVPMRVNYLFPFNVHAIIGTAGNIYVTVTGQINTSHFTGSARKSSDEWGAWTWTVG